MSTDQSSAGWWDLIYNYLWGFLWQKQQRATHPHRDNENQFIIHVKVLVMPTRLAGVVLAWAQAGAATVIICIELQPVSLFHPDITINYFVSLSNGWVQSYLHQHGGPVKLSRNLLYWVITLKLFCRKITGNTGINGQDGSSWKVEWKVISEKGFSGFNKFWE